MREIVLTKGQFAGKTVVFENDGEDIYVICHKCGWKSWQTFFIDNPTELDIHRACEECGSALSFDVK